MSDDQNFVMEKITDFSQVCAGHFLAPSSLDERRAIMSRSLTMVEIEVSSFCNRVCSFCPNKDIDRKSENILMPENLYNSIFDQLASLNYKNLISYARYSEPLADKGILDRINYARKVLPQAQLRVVTNGDYLNRKYIDELVEAGLDELLLSVYLPEGSEFSEENISEFMMKIERKIQIPLKWRRRYDGINASMGATIGRLSFVARARNFGGVRFFGSDRGGLIAEKSIEKRRSPCVKPFGELLIDYNGKVVPCCNIRSDSPAHANYIFGDLTKQSISDVYFSNIAEGWRRGLFRFSDSIEQPCDSCSMGMYPENDSSIHYLDSLLSRSECSGARGEQPEKEIGRYKNLLDHIKRQSWYKLGVKLGLMDHKKLSDFKS